MNTNAEKIVFLDRDGTINLDSGYICTPEDLVLLPGAAQGIAALKRAGLRVVVISNQSAIARGYATAAQIERTNQALSELLLREEADAKIDLVLYCPHGPEDGCPCRKPQTGLATTVTERFPFVPTEAWVVGDKWSDIEFGKNLGIPAERRYLLKSQYTTEEERSKWLENSETQICDSLLEAAQIITGGMSASNS